MSKKTSSSNLKSVQRKRCFFDIDVSGNHAGRIIFELFNDICPKTCENFRALCTGEKGLGLTTNKKLYFKGSPIHRVVKGFIIQGGDFSNGDGTGGESIYGGCFPDEYLGGKHDKSFLLSMANRGKDTNGSQFFVTCAPAPHLDGKHVVFGHVIQGFEVIKLIENLATDDKNRPFKHVNLAHCGELIMKIKKKRRSSVSSNSSKSSSSSSSSSSDSSSGSSSASSASESSSSESEVEGEKEKEMIENELPNEISVVPKQNEEDVFCSIKAGEVPPIPENKFLMRRSNLQATNQQAAHSERENRNLNSREREGREDRRRMKDAAGRKVKGRGFLRFNTRRSRSRSRTPVHWRRAVYDRSRPERMDQKVSRTNSAPTRDYNRREQRRSQDESRERENPKSRKSDISEIRTSRRDRRSTSESKEPVKSKEKRSRSRDEKSKKNKERRHRRRSTSRSREMATGQQTRSRSKSQPKFDPESRQRSRTRSNRRKRSNTRSRS